MRRILRLLPVLLTLLALAACSNQPAGVDTGSPAQPSLAAADNSVFMPLAPGNHWTYDYVQTAVLTLNDGGPQPPMTIRQTMEVTHLDYQMIAGAEYVMERVDFSGVSPGEPHPVRQDRAGYYLFDRSKAEGKSAARALLSQDERNAVERISRRAGADPASVRAVFERAAMVRRTLRGLGASPPGGPLSSEVQTLAYPLHPGATWVVRDIPLIVATVEAHEQFRGFPAWRIRLESELYGDDGAVTLWFSRCGEVGSALHFEGDAVNESGVVVGTVVVDDLTNIASIDIDRGGCDIVASGGGGGGGRVSSFPLAVGNRWLYRVSSTVGGEPVPPLNVEENQSGWVDIEGRTYMTQNRIYMETVPFETTYYLREDHDGLYRLDTFITGAAARRGHLDPLHVAGAVGPEMDERVMLSYPLKVGESWTMLEIPDLGVWTVTVEAQERVYTDVGDFLAFRTRIEHPFQTPGDIVLQWWSPAGMVKADYDVYTEDGRLHEMWELIELNLE